MIKNVAHIGITVENLKRAVAFYRDILGLRYLGEMKMEGEECRRLFDCPDCTAYVAYLRPKSSQNVPPVELIEFNGVKTRSSVPSLFKTSISELCFECDDIDLEYRRLSSLGVRFLSEPQSFDSTQYGFGKSRAVYFYDSEENILELISPVRDTEAEKAEALASALAQLRSRTEGEAELIPNLANAAAILYSNMPDINWVGFYIYKENQLVLGPFQGKAAVVRIALDKGVCGRAFSENTVMNVPDVHSFPGHIACDVNSRSELVLPIRLSGRPAAVLDIDSPIRDRFTKTDISGLMEIVAHLEMLWANK